ncbi:MAG: hypothetical protein ACRDH2_21130 [Anaerolineales bacterium]
MPEPSTEARKHTPASPPPNPDPVPKPLVFAFGVYTVSLSLVLLYLLVKIWPGTLPPSPADTVSLFLGFFVFQIPPETRILLVVFLAGGLGSYVHLATSFADYVGNRQLVRSWLWWYVIRPFVGMALAVIVYFVIRAGLVTLTLTNVPPGELNLYAIAATSGLAGMFSKQATDKLREIFEYLFTTRTPTKRADPLNKSGGEGKDGEEDQDKNPPTR